MRYRPHFPALLPFCIFLLVFSLTRAHDAVAARTFGEFRTAGSMTTARAFHTATLLSNGKVLIAGGYDRRPGITYNAELASAEIFDPETDTFTATGNMTTPRAVHSAILLPDGRVLLAGGYTDGVPNSTLQLYDPQTGAFMSAGRPNTGAYLNTATLLHNGRVLLIYSGGAANPELYDPSTDTFTPTGPFAAMSAARPGTSDIIISAAVLLSDGKVLFAAEPASELYDPLTNTFSLTNVMAILCYGDKPSYIGDRTATLLANGKVLLTGGVHEDCGSFNDAELFDPATNTFNGIAKMTSFRYEHRATLLSDGMVFVSGGISQNCISQGCNSTAATVELFNPATGSFTRIGDMSTPRGGHTATLLQDGTVLIAGGYGFFGSGVFGGPYSTAELYTSWADRSSVAVHVSIDAASVPQGGTFNATFSGRGLDDETYFDIRFRRPGGTTDEFALKWQHGRSSPHAVPFGTKAGIFAVTGIRVHQTPDDDSSEYFPVLTLVRVDPFIQ